MKKMVHLEWSDPTSVDEWINPSEVPLEANKIESCGFLLKNDKDIVIIALNLDLDTESVSQTLTIPKGLIIKMRYLK